MPTSATIDPADLAAMIGSRICHDLISPIGAIANGVELLGMSGAAPSPELALISESVTNANARIRFFRITYGHASAEQSVARSEIMSILDGLYQGTRLKVNWMPGQAMPRTEVRIACLMIQCLESAMPYGGEIRISKGEDGWMIVGESPKTKQDEDVWVPLENGEMPAVSANQVHFAVGFDAIHRAGRQLKVERQPERIVFTF